MVLNCFTLFYVVPRLFFVWCIVWTGKMDVMGAERKEQYCFRGHLYFKNLLFAFSAPHSVLRKACLPPSVHRVEPV